MNGNSWNCHSHDICNHYTVIDSQSSQLERLFSLKGTARSLEDETRNGQRKSNRNPEWWGDLSQEQTQFRQKSRFESVPRDTLEFKSNQNLNSTLYREIPRNLSFSILTG